MHGRRIATLGASQTYCPKLDVAIGVIRNAFDPFVSVVELYENQTRLRFRVFDSDGKLLLSVLRLSAIDIVDPAILRAEVEEARARLERQGLTLKAWKPPW